MTLTDNKTTQQGSNMTTTLPYIGYDKPLTESNSFFTYSERLENATFSFLRIARKGVHDRSEMTQTIVEEWQVDLMDLVCTIADDPQWREFMRDGQKMTVKAT